LAIKGFVLSLSDLKLPVPAIELVPHRNRMLLIDRLDDFKADAGYGLMRVKNDGLFIDNNGKLDTIVYVELLAQLVAAHSGYEAKLEKSKPKTGFLVGIKNFNISETVSAGDMITMQIKKDYEFEQINYINGKILYDNNIIAEGTLKLWEQTGDMKLAGAPETDIPPEKQMVNFKKEADSVIKKMFLNRALAENIHNLSVSDDVTSAEAKMYFPEGFAGFDGHFPGSPLLPGVLMLKCGVLIAEIITAQNLKIKKIHQAKFTKSLFPGQTAEFKLKLNRENNKFRINVVILHEEETCSKFSISGQAV
jgi:3-hydroxyacyl-[acyl-carrier-protein] dehydratase